MKTNFNYVKNIHCLKRPSNYNSKFRPLWENNFSNYKIVPPIPVEIDLLYQDTNKNYFVGVEIKLFTKSSKKVSTQYYRGLEQAISLYQYGFDIVAIWHFFDYPLNLNRKTDLEQLKGPEWYWHYYQKILQLPIDFTFFIIDNNDFIYLELEFQNNIVKIINKIPFKKIRITYQPNSYNNVIQSNLNSRHVLLKWLKTQKQV